ncbi:tetratricopeptide repeat protein [Sphingomonas sp. LT1P40]|uniref:tetratricopeptide repeat protein n=1 Tax=Alteristakelama amylovorans TaxID=3096166 RepID=UPI002FCBF1E0
MFDDIPVQIWLLPVIAAVTFFPARHLYRQAIDSRSTPSNWRASGRFWGSLIALIALAGFAIFIFTPAAGRFAQSRHFWPLLIVAGGIAMLAAVARSVSKGRIRPLAKGFPDSYERAGQPARFWLSAGWNSLLGLLFLWLGVHMHLRVPLHAARERCQDATRAYPARERLAACNALIEMREETSEAEGYVNRGLIFLDHGKLDRAVADFTEAHRLAPDDPVPLANRGIAYAWKRQEAAARSDFAAVRALEPSNLVAFRGEALLSLNRGDPRGAIGYLSAALRVDPGDRWSLAMRADIYKWLGDEQKMRADTAELQRLKAEDR